MSANQLYLTILFMMFIGKLALTAACVKWGLKWAGIANVSLLRALGLFFLIVLISCVPVAITLTSIQWALPIDESGPMLDLLAVAMVLLSACLIVALTYKVRLTRAAKAIVPLVVADVASLVPILLIRWYAYEGFEIPTNAMAPTLLGVHWETPCPRCGEAAYGSPLDPRIPIPAQGVSMICSNERRPVLVPDPPDEVGEGDRILVCKLIAPKRWDMIVFRYPEDPAVNYVKRLVGLPGEKLAIRDGAVWINGEKLDPPESLKGTQYSPTIEWRGEVHSGPGSEPVELGPDEYFVLGDFGDQSTDSRFWEHGAPGYPPYAVPESYITGVVINIYWPINRWKAFR
jgi:signal peptidase I